METQVKNRGWVKNAAIIFLAVLLVLTFFSNSFMNRSLPEVATQSVQNGSITARVRGTGVVTAAGSYEVKAESTRKIQAVMVKAGQVVNQGDVLFVLGEGASEELEAAMEELRQLQLSYQQTAVGIPSFDYSLQESEIRAAEQAMDEARAAMDAAMADLRSRNSDMADYEAKLAAAEKKLNDALSALEDAKAAAAEQRQALWDTIEDDDLKLRVLKAREEELQAQIPATPDPSPDPLPSPSPDPLPSPSPSPSPDPSPDPSPSSSPDPSPSPSPDPSGLSFAGQPTTVRLAPVRRLGASLAGLTDKQIERVRELEEQLDRDLLPFATTELKLAEVQRQIAEVQQDHDYAEAALNGPNPDLERAQAAVDEAQAELDSLLKLLGPYADDYREAKAAYDAAAKELETLRYNLEQSRQANNRSAAASALTLQDLNYRIEQAKKKIEELSGGEENTIVAPVGGIIDSISYTAGNTAPKGEILCLIQVPDLGYTLSFSVTNEQARRLRVGDTASVTNYYWGSQIDATLESIRPDPKAPQTNKLLTFTVTGDVNPGSELTIAVGSKSQNYDLIVPNSAIRSDANGSFVLMVEARNSPLGNRYYARRVEVAILAQDDLNAAVTGELSYGDFVVTTSNRPVQVGDMVRMPD